MLKLVRLVFHQVHLMKSIIFHLSELKVHFWLKIGKLSHASHADSDFAKYVGEIILTNVLFGGWGGVGALAWTNIS